MVKDAANENEAAPDLEAMSHDDLVLLTRWMLNKGYTADEIVYAVEKPWKHLEELAEAKE